MLNFSPHASANPLGDLSLGGSLSTPPMHCPSCGRLPDSKRRFSKEPGGAPGYVYTGACTFRAWPASYSYDCGADSKLLTSCGRRTAKTWGRRLRRTVWRWRTARRGGASWSWGLWHRRCSGTSRSTPSACPASTWAPSSKVHAPASACGLS